MLADGLPGEGERAIGAPGCGPRIMRRLDELARHSSEAGALTRLYLTPEHKSAARLAMQWMRDAGMTAGMDAIGNVVGRYEGLPGDRRTLILGSHIDTVRDAGKYDGALGAVVAIEAIAALNARGLRLLFAIEVVAFGDEEGVRFPVTLSGSRAFAGTFDPAALALRDDSGTSLRDALTAIGCNPDEIGAIARKREDILGYVEVHIEQGPVLEAENLPLGIVTAINGATRLRVEVTGRSGHAGTVPMRLRRDAIAAAAEMILAVEDLAKDSSDVVATVGRIEGKPGAVNVIAGEASFTVDLRSPADAHRHDALSSLRRDFAAIAERRNVRLAVTPFYDEPAASCASGLIESLEKAVRRAGIRPLRLPSGAGHDGLAMAALCPIGMLFVRCAGGVSHHPSESVAEEDAALAARVLIDFLLHLPAEVPE